MDDDILDSTIGSVDSSRIGSSHGVIRGSRVHVVGGTGHAIGRLGGGGAVGEQSSQSGSEGGRGSKANYFSRVSSVANPMVDSAASSSIPRPPLSHQQQSGADSEGGQPTWASEAYRQRVTLSRQGGRRPRAEVLAELDDDVVAIHNQLVPNHQREEIMQRRSSIQALQARRDSSTRIAPDKVTAMREQSLRVKQDLLRRGSGLVAQNSDDAAKVPVVETTMLGVGPGAEPHGSSEGARPGTATLNPVNPLANRQQQAKATSGGRRVAHLVGAPRPPPQQQAAVSVNEDENGGGCFCF